MDYVSNFVALLKRKWRALLAVAAILFIGSQAFACYQRGRQPAYSVTQLLPSSPFHGVTGLAVAPNGDLYAVAPNGAAILKVRTSDGRVSSAGIALRDGADGISIRPDGAMVWTNMQRGAVYFRDAAGKTVRILSGATGVRSAAFAPDGSIYAAQIGDSDALWRIDPTGATPPAKVSENLGGLRGFAFGPDGNIYGALQNQKVLAKINPKTGEVLQTVTGYEKPVALAFAPDGAAYAVDGAEGIIDQVDFSRGSAMRLTWLRGGFDDIAIDAQGVAYLSLPADDTIIRLNLRDRSAKELVKGKLGAPSDLGVVNNADGAMLAIADQFALRVVEMNSGAVTDWLRVHAADIRRPSGVGVGLKYVLLANPTFGSVTVVDRVKQQPVAQLGGFSMPLDALETEDGKFAVLDSSVGELSLASQPDGAERRTIVHGLKTPIAMASDGVGGIFVTESGAGRVVRVDTATGELSEVVNGLDAPQGIDIAPDGRLIVAEAGAGRVIAIDRDSGDFEVLADKLNIKPARGAGETPVLYAGLAVSADGVVFVSSSRSNVIYKLSPPR